MKVIEKLKSDKICISCEMFPPKSGMELKNAAGIVHDMAKLNPGFISITYGAAGTNAGEALGLTEVVQQEGVPAVAHLTCVNSSRVTLHSVVEKLQQAGVENILALRGDILGEERPRDFAHSIDLVRELRQLGDFCIGGACYPQGHPEAASLEQDIDFIKQRVDAGCEFLITQMTFDNDEIYSYMYRLLSKGINVPVIPGIMPVTNVKTIKHICELGATKLPPSYRSIIEKFEDKPEAMLQAGIAYATGQIIDLIANGFTNIHIYSMNKPNIIGGILRNIGEIIQ